MVDAAVDVAKVLFEKLLFCKEQFDDLVGLSDDLSDQLQQLIHLCEQRQREPKFAGAVQRHFTKRLRLLSDDLCAIMSRRVDGGIGTKALLFIGSLWGGGAAADKKLLEAHSTAIDKLLTKLQIEAGTMTATATEELAGGAAAKFIRSEALQRFWRNQFKNELKLPWDGFKESLQQLHEMQLTFPHSLANILSAVKGKMDRLGFDNQIHVSEFSEFFGASDTPNYQNIADMVRGHMTKNRRTLLPAIAFSTVDAVVLVAEMDDFIAMASASGFVKLYSNAVPDFDTGACGLSLICQVTLPFPPDALCVALIENRMALLVGLPQVVHWYDAWSGALVCTIQTQDHPRLIASSQGMLFVAEMAASPRVQTLRYATSSGSFEPVSVLSHHSSVRAVCPLGRDFAVCSTASTGCTVWNVQHGSAVFHIPLQRFGSPRQLLHDHKTGRFVLVGSQSRSIVSIVLEHLSIETLNVIDASFKVQQADIQELSSDQGLDNASLMDGQDEIHSFGHAAIVVKDQLVKVYQYTVASTGAIQVTGMRLCFLPTSLHKPKIISLSSRSGFIAAGYLFGKQAPVFMLQEMERRRVPVLATPLNWLPIRPHFETGVSWSTSGHPAVSARSPTNQPLLISSCNSNCIQVSTLNAKTVVLNLGMECVLSIKGSTMSSHISALALDGLDVIVATGGGWVMRYDFTSPATSMEKATSAELVEVSSWVGDWVDIEPKTSLQAQQRIMCLSEATVRLVRQALAQAGLPHRLEQNLEELSISDCAVLYKSMVNLKAELVAQCASQQNITPNFSEESCCDYRTAARWSRPVAERWIFDGEESCNMCNRPLLPSEFIRQLCDGCVKTRGKCTYCNRRCDDHTLCDPCHNSRVASMRLRPMSLAVCGMTLVVGSCVDDGVYGPTGGTIITMNAKTLTVIDRLSKSWVPHFSNVAAYNMASCGIHIYAAPISYCTVGIFGAAADKPCGTLEAMISSFNQPQCCNTIAMDHGPTLGTVDIFSASLSRDLLWVQVQVDASNAASVRVAANRTVCHITNLLSAYAKLVVSDGLLFAGDRLFGTTVYRRGIDTLDPLLYCQSQTARFDHALMFGRYFLTLGGDGAVGVLPVSYVEKLEAAVSLAGKANSIHRKRSLLVVPSTATALNAVDNEVVRIDKHWSWRACTGGPNEPFISVNDVQKEEMRESLASSLRIFVRRPESIETEELVVNPAAGASHMLLLPSRREVVEVTDIASGILSYDVKDPFLGTEHLVRLREGETMTFAFNGVVPADLEAGKRKWVLMRLLWCTARCLVEFHSPSGAFDTCTVEVKRKRSPEQHVWVCLGECAIAPSQGTMPCVVSVVEGLAVFKRSPAVCEKRCLPKSPALFVETSSRMQS